MSMNSFNSSGDVMSPELFNKTSHAGRLELEPWSVKPSKVDLRLL